MRSRETIPRGLEALSKGCSAEPTKTREISNNSKGVTLKVAGGDRDALQSGGVHEALNL